LRSLEKSRNTARQMRYNPCRGISVVLFERRLPR